MSEALMQGITTASGYVDMGLEGMDLPEFQGMNEESLRALRNQLNSLRDYFTIAIPLPRNNKGMPEGY
jgi:hypothetical protein